MGWGFKPKATLLLAPDDTALPNGPSDVTICHYVSDTELDFSDSLISSMRIACFREGQVGCVGVCLALRVCKGPGAGGSRAG